MENSTFCEKFGKKVLVWQAICQCGMKSSPFFTLWNMKNEIHRSSVFKNVCYRSSEKNTGRTLFWPDLASCHYARYTLGWYHENEFEFMEKEMNPPNCPQIRPIEKFWALMKGPVRKKNKGADDLDQFKKDWRNVSKSIGYTVVQNLMSDIKKQV